MTMTSFPFLAIARKHGLDYGVVIRAAQAIENNKYHTLGLIYDDGIYQVIDEILWALLTERSRREIQQLRTGGG